jgi:photosystem II stability/assembly factor-like uncharacterized protein
MTKKKNKQKIYKDNKVEYIKNIKLAEGRYIAMKLISVLKEIICIFVVVTILATSSQAQVNRVPGPQVGASVTAIASTDQCIYVGAGHGMVVSSDNGTSWQKCTIDLTDAIIESIVTAGETIFTGTQSQGFFMSTDKGGHWKSIDSVFKGKHIQRVNSCAGVVIVRDDDGSTYISFDNGVTWRDDELGKKVNALATTGSLIVAATNSHGIYRTSDSGTTWVKVNGSPNFEKFASIGHFLFGNNGQGVFRSSDSGQTWVNVKSADISQIAAVDSVLVAALRDNNSVLRSADNGVTWEQIKIDDSQDTNHNYSSGQLAVHNSKLYISAGRGLFQSVDRGTTWNSVTTGLLEDNQLIAFNVNLQRSSWSEAFVEFKLPSPQNVEVTICSSTGRLVKTLVNKRLEAGPYSFRLDLRTLGSGYYLAKMRSSAGIQTKKFMK